MKLWLPKRPSAGWGPWLRRFFLRLGYWSVGLSMGLTLLYRFLPIPATPLMLIRSAEQRRDPEREARWKHDWVSADEISPHLHLAVVCAEDQNFYTHWGFDLEAIDKAVEHNKKSRRKRGASTISQQTAKNVFLWPGRSWLRKGLEVWFTGLIELFWSKKRILHVYLNCIEFGDGIYGAEAAARHFFKKKASQLTPQEAALLAAVLPSPLRYNAANPGGYVRKRQSWILDQMRMMEPVLREQGLH